MLSLAPCAFSTALALAFALIALTRVAAAFDMSRNDNVRPSLFAVRCLSSFCADADADAADNVMSVHFSRSRSRFRCNHTTIHPPPPHPHTHTHARHFPKKNQLVLYWGQNSYGATHSDVANFQKRLAFYCGAGAESVTDTFPLAFLTTFFGEGGLPSLDLSNVSPSRALAFAERRFIERPLLILTDAGTDPY